MSDLVLVIALPTDSYVAPGRTYVTTFSSQPDVSGSCDPKDGLTACDPPHCSPPCCALESAVEDVTSYVIAQSEAQKVGFYLGDLNASLPIEATYRRLWGPAQIDAISLGLPLDTVTGTLVNGGLFLGPGGAPALESRAYLQSGCYSRTLQPYAPFAEAFPPDIHVCAPPSPPTLKAILGFDATSDITGNRTIPTFQINRPNGLDGWTAYLRDQSTKSVYSNTAALSGAVAPQVVLATSHLADPAKDALTLPDLELVIAPPPGTPLPAFVVAPTGTQGAQLLAAMEPYPTLPTPVTVSGRLATPNGAPVEADLVFTATDIFDQNGAPLPPSNFEFVARASARRDSKTGASTYSVLLPRGEYQVVVLPRDASNALAIVSRRVGGPGDTLGAEDIFVGPRSLVRGTARVADGRHLAAALVELVPSQCATESSPSVPVDPSAPCMPRAAQAMTADDGSFVLAVDPGGYLLRVRPIDGSRLPWVIRSIVVGLGSMDLPPVVIPAPVTVSMTLTDATKNCLGNCVGNALVRVFTDPSQGARAVQLGQAITDTSGHFEMDLAPPAQ